MINKTKISALVASALLICAAQAQAAPTWTFTSSTTTTQTSGTPNTITMGGVTAQGWSNTNGSTNYDGYSSGTTPSPSEVSAINSYNLETAYLGVYGTNGLGVNNRDGTSGTGSGDYGDLASNAPEHAIDNNQRYDSVLFSFGSAVNLTSMTTGWVGCAAATSGSTSVCDGSTPAKTADSDFTVWYYTGSSATPFSSTATYGALGSGWTLLGSYDGGSTKGTTSISDSAGIYSSYWLIGAYNDVVSSGQTAGNDYFKIAGLTGTVCTTQGGCGPKPTPEPGTLLLMGAGMLGLMRLNTRRMVRNTV
jgi:PEP-CTERM motif